jgi:hypothetical protein
VNGLAAAYCPILASESDLSQERKRSLFHNFNELVYGRLTATDSSGNASN